MGEPQNKTGTGRNADGTLRKGAKLNPGGRPKENEMFRERARKAVDEHVLDAWVSEVTPDEAGERGKDWVKCSELLVAYGYGKPASAPEDNDALRDAGRPLEGMTAADIVKELRSGK